MTPNLVDTVEVIRLFTYLRKINATVAVGAVTDYQGRLETLECRLAVVTVVAQAADLS